MNLKKYLKEQADKDIENVLTESDLQFCMQLAQDVKPAPAAVVKTNKTKIWACICSAMAAALAVVIVVPLTVFKKPVTEIQYKEENIAEKACTLQEVNSTLSKFIVDSNEENIVALSLRYDSISNDNLYYTAYISTFISKFTLYIVVNDKYDFNFTINSETLTKESQEYTINYAKVLVDELSDVEAKYMASIQLETEIVYIEYDQTIDLGEQAFFDDIQNVLKVKN